MTDSNMAARQGWVHGAENPSPTAPYEDAAEAGDAAAAPVGAPADEAAALTPPESPSAAAIVQRTAPPEESVDAEDTDAMPAVALVDLAAANEFIESDDGLIRFGPHAALKPVPARPADQPGEVLEHVPDIALDWLDVGGGQIRAASARGHLHRHLGEIRQDSYAFQAFDDYVAIAVADGVGSASASHLGSAIVARHVVLDTGLHERLRKPDAEPSTETLDSLAQVLTYEATKRRLEPQELATNLLVAVIPIKPGRGGTSHITLLKIGDPSAWRRNEDGWTECRATGDDNAEREEGEDGSPAREPDEDSSGPASTATDALPVHTAATVWRERFISGEVLALTSDGVGNIVTANDEFTRELSALWRTSVPAPAVLLKILDATVKSFDDDRTFVGYRFS